MNRDDLYRTISKAFDQMDADNGVLSDDDAIAEIEENSMLEVPDELTSDKLAPLISGIGVENVVQVQFPQGPQIAMAARNGAGNLTKDTLDRLKDYHSED